jgi:thiamine biosynthesis protein ThiS
MKITVNDRPHEVVAGTTLAELLDEMGLQPKLVAVEVNLQVVPRQQHGQCTLQEGDRLEIVTLVGGG